MVKKFPVVLALMVPVCVVPGRQANRSVSNASFKAPSVMPQHCAVQGSEGVTLGVVFC